MRKRLSSKLLSVILTLAICATTVFGCLMTVSAADPCYAFSTAVFAEDDFTQATIDVTFTAPAASLPDGFTAGAFSWEEVDKDNADSLVLKGITAVTAGVNLANEGNYYVFDLADAKKEVSFKFTFGFSAGEATKTGKEYKIKLNEVELANSDSAYYTESGSAIGTISAGCAHSVTGVGTPVATGEGGDYGYAVYAQSVCTLCGEQFGYQLVPTAEALDNADASGIIDLLEFGSYLTEAGSTSEYFDTVVADNGETGADWDNAIIIDNAEELVYLCKGSGNETAGKYYKVADGIAGFNLSTNKLDITKSYEANESIITNSGKNHAGGGPGFQGHFDGNGATVYGAVINSGTYAGLFSCTKGDVTIKNINVKLSRFVATAAAGAIVGYHEMTMNATAAKNATASSGTLVLPQNGSLTIENCSVSECYIESKGTSYGCGAGAILGYENNSWADNNITYATDYVDASALTLGYYDVDGNGKNTYYNGAFTINNCYVNLDDDKLVSAYAETNQAVRGGLAAYASTNAGVFSNCVVIGITPYATYKNTSNNNHQHTALASHFSNIYTTAATGTVTIGGSVGTNYYTGKVYQLTEADMQGSAGVVNMPALDWGNTWVMDGTNTYPRLAKPGETSDTIYWDGSVATGFSDTSAGTKDDPIIINTAAELAYLVSSDGNGGQKAPSEAITVTAFSDGSPKYFKIADGIKNIVLQPYAYVNEIKALDSASAVKSYFESGSFTPWKTTGWEGATFCGHFDGNGATIYGMYATSANNAALFCTVDGGAGFENLAIKNSYLTSSADNYQVGALFGTSSTNGYGAKRDGIIWVNNIVVANNYMYNGCLSTQTNRSSIIGGANEAIQLENALIYGNDATYGRDSTIYDMPVLGNCSNGIKVAADATYYDGFTPKTVIDGENTLYYNQIKNSIILDCDVVHTIRGRSWRVNDAGSFENVYTNFEGLVDGVITFPGDTTFTYTEDQLKKISASDALGAAAQTAMPNLTWGTDWFTGDEGEYPAQSPYVEVGVANSSNADFTIVGTNIVYENDGSFSLNIHYIPAYEGFAPTMYVGDTNCTKLYVLDTPEKSSKRDEIGDNTAMMFTLKGISAKDIDKLWHPTLVAQQGAAINWSQSAQISVAKTATATLEGDYDTADKNVAAAVLQYGDASKAALAITTNDYNPGTYDLLEFGSYLKEAGSTSEYFDTVVADNGETGADWDNAIIIDNAEELVYLCKGSGNETAGKYYKVADGIAGFNLSTNKLDITKSYKANESIIKNSGKNHAGGAPGFQGHFDGNGATVYGAVINSNTYAGLFSCTKGDVTIKNINVKLSRFVGTVAAGGIVGYHAADSMSTVTIENCSVTDTYLEVTSATGYGSGVGAVIGFAASAPSWKEADKGVDGNGDGDMVDTIYVNVAYNVKNCYVNLDEEYFVSPAEDGTVESGERVLHGGVVATSGSNAVMVSDCVVIGVTPYSTTENTTYNDIQHTGHSNNFSNVYTDQLVSNQTFVGGTTANGIQNLTTVMTQLTTEQMTGIAAKDNMPTLDWNTVWTTTDGYPTFINKDYVAPDSGYTIYWDGSSTKTAPSVGSGKKDDPYIINTVAELAYIFGQTRDNYAITDGKYYKLADGIKSIVMQPEAYAADIMALGSAADVKTYFEANAANMKQWLYYGWEGSTFCGDIDFNGATVYGIYQVSSTNTGLISNVDAGAVVRNVGIKNSYMIGNASAANYQVGALASVSNGDSYGKAVKGVVWFNGITIANNYLYNNSTSGDRSGVLMAASGDAVYSDNILVYGNDATYGDGVKMPLIGTAANAAPKTVAVPEDLVVKLNSDLHVCAVRNSIILGCTPYDLTQQNGSRFNDLTNCYENVYTDADLANDTFSNGTPASGIKGATQVTDLATLKGDAAQSVVDTFNTANGSTVWYVGAAGDYPGFKEASVFNSSLQAIYDGIVLTPDTYEDTGVTNFSMYATSVNLNSNPYMSFAFEFGGELKEKRDQIIVTFTYTVNGIEYTKTTTPPAFTGDGTVNGTDGWYNKPSSGRFHTYRFKDIPVEALANPIKISASYNGTNYPLGSFSVAGLAYEFECQNKITPSDYYATRIEAAKALLFYTQMIHARYGNVQ